MGAPREGQNGKKADLSVRCQTAKAGDGGHAVGGCLTEHHAPLPPLDGKVDRSRLGRCAAHKGKVALFYPPRLHCAGETFGGEGVACRQHHTARLTVKTGDGAKDVGAVAIAKGKRVCQRVLVVPVGGMGGHLSAFGAYGDLLVLIQQGDGQLTRHKVFVALLVR